MEFKEIVTDETDIAFLNCGKISFCIAGYDLLKSYPGLLNIVRKRKPHISLLTDDFALQKCTN